MDGGKKSPMMILKTGFLRMRSPPIQRSARMACEMGWARNFRFLETMARLRQVLRDQFSREAVSKCWVRSSS